MLKYTTTKNCKEIMLYRHLVSVLLSHKHIQTTRSLLDFDFFYPFLGSFFNILGSNLFTLGQPPLPKYGSAAPHSLPLSPPPHPPDCRKKIHIMKELIMLMDSQDVTIRDIATKPWFMRQGRVNLTKQRSRFNINMVIGTNKAQVQ